MPVIQQMVMAYPYHCCEYMGSFLQDSSDANDNGVTENHIWLQESDLERFYKNRYGEKKKL